MISNLTPDDFPTLLKLHEKFFKEEFDSSELTSGNYLTMFKVTDESGSIITAGGVRTLAEIVLVTDKDSSVKSRRAALVQALQAGLFTAGKLGSQGLHAFVQDEIWYRQLQSHGFLPTAGKPLVYPLG